MIKSLLLIGALTFAPMTGVVLDDTTTPATDETTTEDFDWKSWLEQWFTAPQIAMIMSWITYIGTIIGCVYKIKQLAKSKTLNNEDLKTLILGEVKTSVSSEVANKIAPYLTSTLNTCKNVDEVLKVLVKIQALSQENTAESRLAILDLISQLGVIDSKVVEESKAEVNKQVEEQKAQKVATTNAVDKVIADTSKDDTNGASV